MPPEGGTTHLAGDGFIDAKQVAHTLQVPVAMGSGCGTKNRKSYEIGITKK